MAYRIVLWDQSREGMTWIDKNIDFTTTELVDYIADSEDSKGVPIETLMQYESEWDYLVILTRSFRTEINRILELCSIPTDRVIFPLDAYSLADHSSASINIFTNNPSRRIAWANQKQLHKYITCTTDDLSYIGLSSDNTVLAEMYINNYSFADREISLFHALSNKYYNFTDKQVYFCDIGANIGTTCIYFKKKIEPTAKLLAIEPVNENYKLLKANMIINDLEPDKELLLKYAVGNEDKEAQISIQPGNSGGNSLVNLNTGISEAIIEKRFDTILLENNISPAELKYMWVDVEGFEYYFLLGAKGTLSKVSLPILLEFSSSYLMESGIFDEFVGLLGSLYSGYIKLQDPQLQLCSFKELLKYKDETVLFDIFLVK